MSLAKAFRHLQYKLSCLFGQASVLENDVYKMTLNRLWVRRGGSVYSTKINHTLNDCAIVAVDNLIFENRYNQETYEARASLGFTDDDDSREVIVLGYTESALFTKPAHTLIVAEGEETLFGNSSSVMRVVRTLTPEEMMLHKNFFVREYGKAKAGMGNPWFSQDRISFLEKEAEFYVNR